LWERVAQFISLGINSKMFLKGCKSTKYVIEQLEENKMRMEQTETPPTP
jgi:hypothetical protein